MSLYQVICIHFLQEVCIWYNQKKPKIQLRMENHRFGYSLWLFWGINRQSKKKAEWTVAGVKRWQYLFATREIFRNEHILEPETFKNSFKNTISCYEFSHPCWNLSLPWCWNIKTLTISPSENKHLIVLELVLILSPARATVHQFTKTLYKQFYQHFKLRKLI